jgi:hypothetical protein
MSEAEIQPYDLAAALASDRGDDCLVIDVGGDNKPSVKRVADTVEHKLIHASGKVFVATKLYVIGAWDDASTDEVENWNAATKKIGELLDEMPNLQEVTWISGLPFTAALWKKLPTTLEKLVLDLGQPVRLTKLYGGDVSKSWITTSEMKPLQCMTSLQELRLLRMHDSFQVVVWDAVYRNTSTTGMRVVDLQMKWAPIVRGRDDWLKAQDVSGLNVPVEEGVEEKYK